MDEVSATRGAIGMPPQLTDSARAVLRAVAACGPITRPKLSAMLALSKPTMSMAVAELSAQGLVASQGHSRGATGRTAILYGLGPAAGHVVGVDAGTTHVRAVATSLDGRQLAEAEERLPGAAPWSAARVSGTVRAVVEGLLRSVAGREEPLRAVAVALPTIVPNTGATPGMPSASDPLLRALRQHDAPLLVENNVNCAALAELHHGAARGRSGFVYLQIGVKIGLGIVHDRRLFRGFNGAAGEVSRLPFPWSATEQPRREGLEQYLGSERLLERVLAGWPRNGTSAPASVEELFASAAAGGAAALAAVRKHADDIGRLVSACVGVLDPGLVVLGGGVGQNPLVVDGVRRVVNDLAWTTDIDVSQLGSRATVQGAALLAAEFSLGQLLGETGSPAVLASVPPRSE
jgi:predicted NBD/HSP70 family sugar kinase